jgi:2-methylisocitrate lyase-like PEP mutase family enzyme
MASNNTGFRDQLQQGTVTAPFVYDGLQARLAEQQGFAAVYMTGFGTAARFGLPDVGLTTFSEMLENARIIAGSVDIPLICDADTGYGNPLNVMRTVREYERAGVAALHLEDQQWPKRCGYMAGKAVIPAPEMIQKLRAALDTRRDELLIIARTDALQAHGWDEVEDRARAYREEGADLVFVDGIGSNDLEEYARRLGDLPLVFNNVPLVGMQSLAELPFTLVLHPGSLMALLIAVHQALGDLMNIGEVPLAQSADAFSLALKALDAHRYFELAEQYS